MATRTPIRGTASSRSSGASTVPPSRAYEHAFGSGTPLSPRRAGITSPLNARASPQVKQRLAELRKAKLAAVAAASSASEENSNNNSIDGSISPRIEESNQLDAESIRRPSSRTSSLSLDATIAYARTPSPAASEVTIELGMRSLQEEVDKAKKSGRLNIAARSLEEVPPLVLEQLLPQNSVYHPSNAGPQKVFSSLIQKTADIDLSSSDDHEEAAEGGSSSTPWWEIESLNTFKASNNELAAIPTALAGFETLEVLDLHGNHIASPFPASFGTLSNLTNVNLSNNIIDTWPVELMALVHLKVLDLSHNRLKNLWSLDWKKEVVQRMQEVKRDTRKINKVMRGEANGDSSIDSVDSESTAPDSSAGEDFWSAFSTAPVKTRARAYMPTKSDTDYTVVLPSLTTLNLSHNKLSASSFAASNITSLPPNLTSLDLSSNGISGRIPIHLFSDLSKLKVLNLQDNGLDDNFFIASSASSSSTLFASLETLDLSRNALDSLDHLECALGIPIDRPVVYSGVSSVSLAKLLAGVQSPSLPSYPALRINLAHNFLREELPRRKQMRRADKAGNHVSKDAETTAPQEQVDPHVAVLRLLDDVHQRATARLVRGNLEPPTLAGIQDSLEKLATLLEAGSNHSGSSATASSITNGTKPSPHAADNGKHQSTPVKTVAVDVPGSLRARRQKQEEEARQWAPL